MSFPIEKLIKEGESETLEFKAGRCPLDVIGKTICGMLNQQGGMLLWGVDDEGGPVGLADAKDRAIALNEFLMRRLNPRPLLSVTVHEVRGHEIIAVEVPMGSEKPYSLNREIWVRLGASTHRADHDQSSRLVERSAAALDRWEREPMPGFGIGDCDEQELKQTRSEIEKSGRFGIDTPETHEDLLNKLYIYRNGQLTNAAVVLFAQEPRAWAPNLAIRITTHTAAGEATSDLILEGPAIRILLDAIASIQQRTIRSVAFPKRQLERAERLAYPLYALREGLVNAMVHRDYESPGLGVMVRIFPDHIVITNPGSLPEGWKDKDLGRKHESRPGNPDIARVFYLRALMEQLGLGAQRIVTECTSMGAKSPVWKSDKNSVALTLYSAPSVTTAPALSLRQESFLHSLLPGEKFKAADYSESAGVSERQARRDLAELEDLDIIERSGAGPSTIYLFPGRNS
jgi:ATP-dependent DNA helicase RecG